MKPPLFKGLRRVAGTGIALSLFLGGVGAATLRAEGVGLGEGGRGQGWYLALAGLLAGSVCGWWWGQRRKEQRFSGAVGEVAAELRRRREVGDYAGRIEDTPERRLLPLVQELNRHLQATEYSQRALERANAEMQQRVSERTAALAAANAALEADIAQRIRAEEEREALRAQLMRAHRMEAVGTLAGGIAHDFNNILTGIMGHAQLLVQEEGTNEEIRLHARQMIAASERAASLVRQILTFSRQTGGERRIVSAGAVANEALTLLRAALPAGIRLSCLAPAGRDWVRADPTQLHQVFMNLGTNAGHALMPRGGELSIRIETAPRRLPTAPLPPGEYVEVTVADTGCGMTPEVLERIFDPFFTTKPVNQGTGLGLSVVHGIVTDHGGAIQVTSEVGQGTQVRFWLPAAAPVAGQGEMVEVPRVAVRGRERVLVVDDEELVLSVVSRGLRQMGHEVTAVIGPMEALAVVEQNPYGFDLVLTDQTMPVLSGVELATELKKLRPDMPVILMTGYSPDLAERTPVELGLVAVLGKPLRFEELARWVRQAAP